MRGKKVIFSEDDIQYIRDHYSDTRTQDIAERFNCEWRTISRVAFKLGLKKSPEYLKEHQKRITAAAKDSHLRHGTYPPKGYVIPNSKQYQFKKGETNKDRYGEERWNEIIRKSHESLALTRKRERARAVWCLPQKTKLKVEREPRAKTCQRLNLRQHGYVIEGRYAYYNDSTTRCPRIEQKKRWFIFMPADNINTKEQTL